MSFKLPFPNASTPYKGSPALPNSNRTIPAPGPGTLPTPCWFASPTNVYWQNNADFPNGYAQWSSPMFDLRPDLRGFAPYGYSGSNNTNQRATPVWVSGGTGAGGKLFIQISNLNFALTSLDNLEVLVQESGHISDPGRVAALTPQEDITTAINSTQSTVILSFTPIGEGMPIRFWRCLLVFRKTAAGGTNDPFQIEAAYY